MRNKENLKRWLSDNPERLKGYRATQWEKRKLREKENPALAESRRSNQKNRYHLNIDLERKRGRERSKTPLGFYKGMRGNAQRRNLSVEISLEEFIEITQSPCTYCGTIEKRRGLDRVDNDCGYTKENSVSCCKPCNYMKNKMSLEEFKEQIDNIYKKICV